MKAGEFAKKALDTLPFNGNKTKIGTVITVLGVVQAVLPDVVVTLASNPTPVGLGLVVLGWLHKLLKIKYPSFGSF